MTKIYWFSDQDYELIGKDVLAGNVRPAKKYAQKLANESRKWICIHLGEHVVEWVSPE